MRYSIYEYFIKNVSSCTYHKNSVFMFFCHPSAFIYQPILMTSMFFFYFMERFFTFRPSDIITTSPPTFLWTTFVLVFFIKICREFKDAMKISILGGSTNPAPNSWNLQKSLAADPSKWNAWKHRQPPLFRPNRQKNRLSKRRWLDFNQTIRGYSWKMYFFRSGENNDLFF